MGTLTKGNHLIYKSRSPLAPGKMFDKRLKGFVVERRADDADALFSRLLKTITLSFALVKGSVVGYFST